MEIDEIVFSANYANANSQVTAKAEGSCELNTNKRKIIKVVSTAQKSCSIQNESYLSIITLGLDFFRFILRLH